mmetsp:Transcript_5432/g.11474  ORF Transcript_5432/g.11474 Transcript_5432/m.11474 type:complete len:322 (+) Transcript_5432:1478-2443(+)
MLQTETKNTRQHSIAFLFYDTPNKRLAEGTTAQSVSSEPKRHVLAREKTYFANRLDERTPKNFVTSIASQRDRGFKDDTLRHVSRHFFSFSGYQKKIPSISKLCFAFDFSALSTEFFSPQDYFLLLEIPAVFLVDHDQVEKVSYRKPVVHGAVGWRQIGGYPAHRQLDGNNFSLDGGTVHDFVLDECLRFGENIGTGAVVVVGRATPGGGRIVAANRVGHPVAAGFPPDDGELHVFDLDANQQKMDLPQYGILQVIDTPLVFERDVQAIVDSHLHFDGLVLGRGPAQDLDPDVVFLLDWRQEFSFQDDLHEVSNRDVASPV